MVGWTSITWLCASILSSGTVVDRFLLVRQKKRIYSSLVSFWNSLDETAIPDLPRKAIEGSLSLCRPILKRRALSIGLSVLLSCAMTAVAQFGGEFMGGQRHQSLYDAD